MLTSHTLSACSNISSSMRVNKASVFRMCLWGIRSLDRYAFCQRRSQAPCMRECGPLGVRLGFAFSYSHDNAGNWVTDWLPGDRLIKRSDHDSQSLSGTKMSQCSYSTRYSISQSFRSRQGIGHEERDLHLLKQAHGRSISQPVS